MRILLLIGIALIALGICASCDSGNPVAPEISRLYGSWQWLRSVGGFGGEVRTPQSTGHTVKAVFHENGTARFYQDDILINQYRYTVTKEKPNQGAEEAFVIEFLEVPAPTNRKIISYRSADTLLLTDLCMDCYQDTYARVQQ